MHITQIYLSDHGGTPGAFLTEYCRTTRAAFDSHDYTLFDNDSTEAFLTKHYEPRVVNAYRSLKPYAYKADLARYCIIKILGGWYIDMGIIVPKQINASGSVRLVAFRDVQRNSATSWACSCGFFYAERNHPALSAAIEMCVRNCETKHYGLTSLCPTGPNVWGRAVASAGLETSMVIGDFLPLTPTYQKHNYVYLLPDGTIAAYWKPNSPKGVRINDLGATGASDYNYYWNTRMVFGEQSPDSHRLPHPGQS